MRMNVEDDRLSRLPDDLIYKILSFLDITVAINTSVLSSRWRFLWTSMPYLNFSTKDFSTLPKFSKFVTNVLSHRNGLTEVYSVKLSFRGKAIQVFVKRILDYAFSHNIQQLNVVCLCENDIEFPLSLFTSKSLKHLSLTTSYEGFAVNYLTSTWELPILTTLDLHSVVLSDKCLGIFSKCVNLKNLTLNTFKTKGADGFSIIHPQLSNLTLKYGWYDVKVVNVVAPRLENLIIESFLDVVHVMISAPDLVSLLYKGSSPLRLSTEGFHSLEKADICVSNQQKANAHQIVCLLQHLHNVHFLRLNLEIVELLYSSVEPLLPQSSPFVNLKSLKIYPERLYRACKDVTISNELKSYLLDNSQGSTITLVLREEIKAQNIIAELGGILEKEKDNSKSNPKFKIGGNMVQIKSCRENLGVQIEKASFIMSKLRDIEELLTKLPASNRANIQPCFSTLCVEADIVISKITDGMKIHCEENQSLSSDCFQKNLLQHWSHS